MGHFKFLLDQDVIHLEDYFGSDSVATLKSLSLPENIPDPEIIDVASTKGFVIVTGNRRDFLPMVRAYIAKSTDKTLGCHRVQGLIVLLPHEEHVQRRALRKAASRLMLDGKKITWKGVHDRELLVEVEASGAAKVSRLPRCPHCGHYEDGDK